MHSLAQKILGTCERVANKFLHPGANYTYMYNLHTVYKSAHVNGALENVPDIINKKRFYIYSFYLITVLFPVCYVFHFKVVAYCVHFENIDVFGRIGACFRPS